MFRRRYNFIHCFHFRIISFMNNFAREVCRYICTSTYTFATMRERVSFVFERKVVVISFVSHIVFHFTASNLKLPPDDIAIGGKFPRSWIFMWTLMLLFSTKCQKILSIRMPLKSLRLVTAHNKFANISATRSYITVNFVKLYIE